MNIYYNLTLPKQEESPIRVCVSHKGKKYQKNIGITTKTKSWNGKRTGNVTKDNALRLIRVGLESVLDEFSSEKAISEALARVKDGRWSETPIATNTRGRASFWDYFEQWASRDNPAKRQRKNTMTLVQSLMGSGDDWEQIDSAFYFRLIRKMDEKGYSKNYQGSVVAKIKTVMSEGLKLKYHRNEDFREFRKPSNEVDAVALTKEELSKVWNVKLKDDLESRARDLFIIGCYTGARWEDYSQFTKDNIVDGKFRYIQRKTGARVTLPLSPRLKEALGRNGGKAPEMADAVFNRTIKVVCMRAGIATPIEVRRSKGEKYEHETVPKWKLVSSHTCRRTMCTLLDQEGVPMREIMTISGHKSLASLQRYLRKSERDTEEIFGKVKFFK